VTWLAGSATAFSTHWLPYRACPGPRASPP
jgi:hypothetical protein